MLVRRRPRIQTVAAGALTCLSIPTLSRTGRRFPGESFRLGGLASNPGKGTSADGVSSRVRVRSPNRARRLEICSCRSVSWCSPSMISVSISGLQRNQGCVHTGNPSASTSRGPPVKADSAQMSVRLPRMSAFLRALGIVENEYRNIVDSAGRSGFGMPRDHTYRTERE